MRSSTGTKGPRLLYGSATGSAVAFPPLNSATAPTAQSQYALPVAGRDLDLSMVTGLLLSGTTLSSPAWPDGLFSGNPSLQQQGC